MRVELVAAVFGLGLLASYSGGMGAGRRTVGERQAGPASAQAPASPAMKFDVILFKRCETSAGHTKNTIVPVGGDSFGWECQPVGRMMLFAFATDQPLSLKGQPAWVDDDAYSFSAKVAPEDVAAWGKLDLEVKRAMVREALVDALKIKVHVDTTPRPVYDLVAAKEGVKLTPYKEGTERDLGGGHKLVGVVLYQGTTMTKLAYALTFRMDRPVMDKTDLQGRYDVQLTMPLQHYDAKTASADDTGISDVMAGLKSLGLKLVSDKAPLNGLVMDHVERPPED